MEAYYRAQLDGTTLSLADLKAVFEETWTTELDSDLPLNADDPDTIHTQWHALLDVFAENADPRTILVVEKTFRVPFSMPGSAAAWDSDDSCDIHSRQSIDQDLLVDLVEAGGDGTVVIVDLKILAASRAGLTCGTTFSC